MTSAPLLASLPDDLVSRVAMVARQAGDRIMEIYRTDFAVADKADRTPVTEADMASEAAILPMLRGLAPDIPVVSEEEVSAGRIPDVSGGVFWLVDPLDGTREFVNRRDEFTVNIALVENGVPVLGVLGVPAQDTVYTATGPGTAMMAIGAAPPRRIACRRPPEEGFTVVASRSHGDPARRDAFLARFPVHVRVNAGSAVKFALIARGEADLYPRFGPTMEWDTAAGHAVLLSAGGRVETIDGRPLAYGKPDFRNPEFVAYGLTP